MSVAATQLTLTVVALVAAALTPAGTLGAVVSAGGLSSPPESHAASAWTATANSTKRIERETIAYPRWRDNPPAERDHIVARRLSDERVVTLYELDGVSRYFFRPSKAIACISSWSDRTACMIARRVELAHSSIRTRVRYGCVC